jgi:hypothetical protein
MEFIKMTIKRFRFHPFSCKNGHLHDQLLQDGCWEEKKKCREPGCRAKASLHALREDIRTSGRFVKVVYHVDKDGNKRFPGHADAPVPEGFQKVEIQDVVQLRKFEKAIDGEERQRWAQRLEREEAAFEPGRRERRSQLRQDMQGFSNFGRDFARIAMEEGERRKRAEDVGFRVEAYE